jgi:small GTP-binding protein
MSQKVKLVFIGDSAVGKTSLFTQFQDKEFSGDVATTVGAACANIQVELEGGVVNLIVWDTAGQEKYRGIVPMYFSRAAFILIVYDITNRTSFDNVRGWISLSQSKAPDVSKLVIVGNKCDLEDDRVVSLSEGHELAESVGATFFETSALNPAGVRDLMIAVASAAANDDEFVNSAYGDEIAIRHRDTDAERDEACC